MKKTFLLIVVSLSAFLLSQCQYVKGALKELDDLSSKESQKNENSSSSSKALSSSSSETEETLKKRKETK